MLPLWPDSERLIVGERSMTLVRRKKPVSLLLPFSSSQHINFSELNASLPPDMRALSGRKVKIILTHAWIRYLILPWQPNITSYKDWTALALNRFRERYGSKANDWDVQISMQGYKQPIIAAAIARDLIEGLDQLADENRWQLQTIEPSFASVVNQHRRKWHGNAWLMLAENGRLLLAESKNGVWQRFSVMLSSSETLKQNALMLVQQARQFNADDRKQRLFLFSSNSYLKQDFVEDMEVKQLSEDWLDMLNEGYQS